MISRHHQEVTSPGSPLLGLWHSDLSARNPEAHPVVIFVSQILELCEKEQNNKLLGSRYEGGLLGL